MTMEIGQGSFGDTPRNPDGSLAPQSQAVRNLLDAIVHADRTGLDYFGVGEHHTPTMPVSSPGAIIAAAATATTRIQLGSGANVISTDDPVRVYQQFATAHILSGGRVEITAGRGSSVESFPLFGYSLDDYERLYDEKLDLLMMAVNNDVVTWSGNVRAAIDHLDVVPRTDTPMRVTVATGGSAPSTLRAAQRGLPIHYGIIGGAPARFASLAELYRRASAASGFSGDRVRVDAGTMGLVAPTRQQAIDRFYPGWARFMTEMGQRRGWPAQPREALEAQAQRGGAFFLGSPDDVAQSIVDMHEALGNHRYVLKSDVGGLAHEHLLESIELLGSEVKPRVDRLLAKK